MTIVEKAKALDSEVAAAGGLAAFWIRVQRAKRERGEAYYTTLVDPATDEVIAELRD